MKATAKNQGNIKRMLQVLAMSVLIAAFAGCKGTTDSGPKDDNKEQEQLITLVGTKWLLVGFGDTKTGNVKPAEPKAHPGKEDKIYFLHFDSDSSFKGFTSTNEIYGKYIADYSKKTIWTEMITSMINEFGDGRLFKEILHSNATRTFSATAKTFKIFYNNGDNYMLFEIFTK